MSIRKTLDRIDRECWIETFTGKQFHLLNPHPDEVCIEDIAHALSNQCRFTGHTRKFYSVAEHSHWVSMLVDPRQALAGLLHDAAEAYICDMSTPFKRFTGAGRLYLSIEDRINRVIATKFRLDYPWHPSIKEADLLMLGCEKRALMTRLAWPRTYSVPSARELDVLIVGFPPEAAESVFLRHYDNILAINAGEAQAHKEGSGGKAEAEFVQEAE